MEMPSFPKNIFSPSAKSAPQTNNKLSFLEHKKDPPINPAETNGRRGAFSPNLDPLTIPQSEFPGAQQSRTDEQPPVSTSAIRTMKSDVERLFKTAPPSVSQMITKQAPIDAAVKKHLIGARIYLLLGIVVVLLLITASTAYYFRETLFPPPVSIEIRKAIPPAAFFATENSRTIETTRRDEQKFLDFMSDAMKEFERDGTMKHILFRLSDTPDQHFITLSDFFDFYHIVPPESFLKRFDSPLMMFVYTSSGATRLGLGTHTTDPSHALRDLLDWEPKMITALKPLLFGVPIAPLSPVFEDRTYRNIDWRYLKLSSTEDIGIGYTIFPAGNILIIATSRTSMETAINRLFDAR